MHAPPRGSAAAGGRQQRPPLTAKQSVVQPYFVIDSGQVFTQEQNVPQTIQGPTALMSGAGKFASQVKQQGNFLDPHNVKEANIQTADAPALRVSDDLQMAIEDSDLTARQPKTFFATTAVVSRSNDALTRSGSSVELVPGGERLRVWKNSAQRSDLVNVTPRVRNAPPLAHPLAMTLHQDCQAISGEVTGSDVNATERHMVPSCVGRMPPKKSPTISSGIHQDVAQLVAQLLGTRRDDWCRRMETELTGKLDDAALEQRFIDEIAGDYVAALNGPPLKLNTILQQLKINQFAAPGVGEAYVIATIAGQNYDDGTVTDLKNGSFVPKWGYHFAGVVATSGTDTVALENYARVGEQREDPVVDPRWYFQMYGRGHGQSFHEANVATGGFANPITLALRDRAKVKEEQEREAFLFKVKVGSLAVAAGLLAVAIGVLAKYGVFGR